MLGCHQQAVSVLYPLPLKAVTITPPRKALKMTTGNFYVSDLDGTLLTPHATLSSYTRDTINQLVADGMDFTIATARGVFTMSKILEGLELKLPVICSNGAIIYDKAEGRYQYSCTIDKPMAEELERSVKERFGVNFFHTALKGDEEKFFFHPAANSREQWLIDDRKADDDYRLTERSEYCPKSYITLSLTAVGEKDLMAEVRDFVDETFPELKVYYFHNEYERERETYWVGVYNGNSNKGLAIKSVMESFGHSGSKLTVFGDQLNDLPMFAVADHAVAPSNAAAEVKEKSSLVIGHHQEDAVAQYLKQQFDAART